MGHSRYLGVIAFRARLAVRCAQKLTSGLQKCSARRHLIMERVHNGHRFRWHSANGAAHEPAAVIRPEDEGLVLNFKGRNGLEND